MAWVWVACAAVLALVVWLLMPGRLIEFKKDDRQRKQQKQRKKQQQQQKKSGKIRDRDDSSIKDATIVLPKGSGAGKKKVYSDTEKVGAGKEAKASFDVQFEKGFDWNCTGKVGGFFIGSGKASGGKRNNSKNGASVRFNWDKNGGAFAYAYVPRGTRKDQPDDMQGKETQIKLFRDKFKGALSGGGWKNVELGVKLNTVKNGKAQRNGELTMRIGDKTETVEGIVWRNDNNIKIEKLEIQPFHGGGKGKCATAQKTSTLKIRDASVKKK